MMMAMRAGRSSPNVLGVLVTTVFHTCSAAAQGAEAPGVGGCITCFARAAAGAGQPRLSQAAAAPLRPRPRMMTMPEARRAAAAAAAHMSPVPPTWPRTLTRAYGVGHVRAGHVDGGQHVVAPA
jgi:hypothetical protein